MLASLLTVAGLVPVVSATPDVHRQANTTSEPAHVRVEILTELGGITAEIDVARAPMTAANFLKYVDGGYFDGGRFYRTVRPGIRSISPVPIQVVQADINRGRERERFAPIPLERTRETGILHRDGVLSMARLGPDSATSSFFICIGDQPGLDFGGMRNPDGQGFAAFGRVTSGMEIVKTIHASPVEGESEVLSPPVKIVRIRRIG